MGKAAGLVGGVVGAVVGAYFGGPTGAKIGWMAGSALGGYYAYTNQDDVRQEGPKLEDLKAQVSSYGGTIPYIRGGMRVAGNIIDVTDLVPHTTETREAGGGKGGGGGPDVVSTTTTYSVSVDIALAGYRETVGVRKIWANKQLIFDDITGLQAANISQMRVYTGTETQDADPLFTALRGVTPAYRGLTHIVLEDFDLTGFFNRIPQFEFLVVADGGLGFPSLIDAGLGGQICSYDNETGYVWSAYETAGGVMTVHITQWQNAALVNTITTAAGTAGAGGNGALGMCYVDVLFEHWIPRKDGDPCIEIFSGMGKVQIATIAGIGDGYGLLRYNPYSTQVWRCRSISGLNSHTVIVYDVHTRAVANTAVLVAGFGFGICDVVFLSDARTAVVLLSASILLVNTETFVVTDIIPTLANATPTTAALEYDTSREKIIITYSAETVNGIVGDYQIFDIASKTITSHSFPTNAYHCIYMPTQDKYVFLDSGVGQSVRIINPDTLAVEDTFTPAGWTGNLLGEPLRVPNDMRYIAFGNFDTPHTLYKIPVRRSLTTIGVQLDELVSDLCVLGGMDPTDIDVSDLASDSVDGYLIASQMSARSAIEPLQQAYYFDAVESDDVLKFVKRGGAIAGTMLQEDRAGPGGELDSDLQITRAANDVELPNQVDTNYIDVNADYQLGAQYERRITRDSISTAGLTLPIAMTATKAKECASVALYSSWLRQSFSWSTTRKYSKYEPTDVITLPTASATYTARITSKRDTVGGSIEWEGTAEDANVYSPSVVGAELGYVPATVNIPPPTTLRLMDINLLRDQDDANGFYAAATGLEPWSGSQLMRSIDAGQSYQVLTSFTSPVTIGTALTVLGDWTGGEIFEYINSVDVILVRGSLSNATEDEVLNGANLIVIGNEFVQPTTALLIASDTYRLSGFLRGRRGTEWAKSTHAIGDRVVLAELTTWRNVFQDNASIGLSYKYRAPTFGQTLAQAVTIDFTNNAARLKPYSPAHIKGVRDGSNNLTITWLARSRVDGEWRDLVETPLSDSDIYDIDVYNPGYTVLKRTIASIAGPSQAYSAANQTTDGYTPGDPVSIDVFQKSATVGRGYGRRVII